MDKSEENILKAQIYHYFNEKLYTHMLNAAKEGASKFKGDVSLHLYHSLALILINRLEESIHDLESIRNENDVKLAVTIALIYTHKMLGVANKELYVKLDGQMKEYRKSSEAVDFYHSSFVLLCLGKPEKALDYAEKALYMKDAFPECQTLKGWILMQLSNGKKPSENIKDSFQAALQLQPSNLWTIIGLSQCYLFQNDFAESLSTINKAVVRFSGTVLPLVQKIRVHLYAFDWDQAMETIHRVSAIDPNNLFVQKLYIVILLCRSERDSETTKEVRRFFENLESKESGNIQLMIESAQLFSKICGRKVEVLSEVCKTLESAVQNNPESSGLIVEIGNQCLLRGKPKEAARYFKNATKIDETSLDALLGVSQCELAENGTTPQLRNQIDFLLEMKGAQQSPLLQYLQAKASTDSEEALQLLTAICQSKLSLLKNYPYSDHYLLNLDPDFLLEVIKEALQHISLAKTSSRSAIEVIFETLNVIVRGCPGLSEAVFLLAKLQYVKGDNTSALSCLEELLGRDLSAQTEAQLLLAQIQVQQGLFDRATQSLEMCVSQNFKVRENPIYHYITGLVDKNSSNFPDAIRALSTALSLVNIKSEVKSKDGAENSVTLVEKASIYVELIDTLNIVGQTDEAVKVLEDATEELRGTPEEARILLLSADHSLTRNNIQGAIDLLSRIKPTDSCYLEAKSKEAEILLKYRKDKYAFLQYYQDFVKENPSSEYFVMLGDAYMKVLEPDEALQCYEKALKDSPKDAFLTSKMGKALVESHYFSRAVTYYKETIDLTNDVELKLQLAELYMNLKDYEKGELILLNEMEEEKLHDLEDLTYLRGRTRLLSLLAQIQEKSGNVTYAMRTLKDALSTQNRIKKRVELESGSAEEETQVLVDICVKLGEMAIVLKNNEQAISFYKEGLQVSPDNKTILVALAKLYMQINYLELCQKTCSTILKIDPDNESASVMMADIAFRKVDFDMAHFHFTQLVTKQPSNWAALIRLIEILRRTGNIDDCPEYLTLAEKHCENPAKELKFLYCTALYQWYSGNLNGALTNFNVARQDVDLGQQAIYNMIEICLNPDDEMSADEFLDSEDIEYKDSRSMALKTADRLLREVKQRLDLNGEEILKYRLLTDFRLLATREKFNVERALDDFVALTSENAYKDNIGTILGIATAHTLLKQGQRAKNQLKRIAKSTWTFEDAEYLERAWILLADHYIQSSKFDIASELINKVVLHNKACVKAYELLGFIAEKEQRYKDASNFYEKCWLLGGKANPSVGFKLAYCLMKRKKYPDAIMAAQEVLKLSPGFPRVSKDIIEKCMSNLRI